jgi:peptidyl-prolyl cis-trans isomerase A (cyclophilin A)
MPGPDRSRALLLALLALLATLGSAAAQARKPGTYATFDTTMGTITCELYEKITPATVANFIALAEGKKEWLTPKGELLRKPLYDGVIFHRVLKGLLIQAGDATRSGNFPHIAPFPDEIVPTLRFDRPGVLAMANNGPNTNRTQFFITVAPAAHLNGKHTIFGRVVEGLEVVRSISEVRLLAGRPVQDVTIRKVTIARTK